MLGPGAAVDVKPALEVAGYGRELDEPAGGAVKQPQLERPVALGRQLAGEVPPIRQGDPAAECRRVGSLVVSSLPSDRARLAHARAQVGSVAHWA